MTDAFEEGRRFGWQRSSAPRLGRSWFGRLGGAGGAAFTLAVLFALPLSAQPNPPPNPAPESAGEEAVAPVAAGNGALEAEIGKLRAEVTALREELARAERDEAAGRQRSEQILLLQTRLAELEARLAAGEPAPPQAGEAETAPGGLKLTPGAQAWLRGEVRTKPTLGRTDAQTVRRILQRARLQLNAQQGPVTAFVQVQDAREWGFETSTISNEGNVDLHQGYLEVSGSTPCYSGFLRAGRQEITYGSQRLIGDLGWDPNARAFDALRLHGEDRRFEADAFLAVLAPPQTFTLPAADDPTVTETFRSTGSVLGGLRLGADVHEAFQPELYMLWDRSRPTERLPAQDRNVYSPGLRVSGDTSAGLSYEAEGYLQFGDVTGRDHSAWAFATGVAYTYEQSPIKPTARAGYSMASGEACENAPGEECGASESREFFNFYPLNHAYYGMLDLFGWRNVRDLEIGVGATPLSVLEATLTYHFFQLHEARGRWSDAAGATIAAGDFTNTQNTLGHEIDLVVTYRPWEFLALQPGYGIFVPTGAGEVLGGPGTQQFFYLMASATL
jgi:hypothetical protein